LRICIQKSRFAAICEHKLAAKMTMVKAEGANGRMCMKNLKILLALTVIAPAFADGAFGYTGEELAKTAKVTLEQATDIALRTRPGKITDKELEREKGGTGLRYSFDIRNKGITYEVGIDAQTGAVLENIREGAHPD